jgi:hypothetical protein
VAPHHERFGVERHAFACGQLALLLLLSFMLAPKYSAGRSGSVIKRGSIPTALISSAKDDVLSTLKEWRAPPLDDIGKGTLSSPCTGFSSYVRERLEASSDAECKFWLDTPGTDYTTFYSQYHQDAFLFYNFFRCRDGPGSYLDIGAYQPKRFSNTWFFDRCLGWRGICAEADPQQAAPFRTDRSCFVIAQAVSVAAGVGSLSGMDWGGVLIRDYMAGGGAQTTITTMNQVLLDAGWVTNETKGVITVDFLSLDVENHELEVLMAMPWDRLNIRFLTIENNFANLVGVLRAPEPRKAAQNFIDPPLPPADPNFQFPPYFRTRKNTLCRGDLSSWAEWAWTISLRVWSTPQNCGGLQSTLRSSWALTSYAGSKTISHTSIMRSTRAGSI